MYLIILFASITLAYECQYNYIKPIQRYHTITDKNICETQIGINGRQTLYGGIWCDNICELQFKRVYVGNDNGECIQKYNDIIYELKSYECPKKYNYIDYNNNYINDNNNLNQDHTAAFVIMISVLIILCAIIFVELINTFPERKNEAIIICSISFLVVFYIFYYLSKM